MRFLDFIAENITEKLQINLQIENKTIEKNQVLIKIKRLVNCKSSKY